MVVRVVVIGRVGREMKKVRMRVRISVKVGEKSRVGWQWKRECGRVVVGC